MSKLIHAHVGTIAEGYWCPFCEKYVTRYEEYPIKCKYCGKEIDGIKDEDDVSIDTQ